MNRAVPPSHAAAAAAAALAAVLAAACSAPAPPPPAPSGEFPALSADEFPGAQALLRGFDAPTDDATWLAQDRALFGLRLDRDGEVVRWLLSVELPLGQRLRARSPGSSAEHEVSVGASATWHFGIERDGATEDVRIDSRLASARVRVFTAEGELLTETTDTLPVDLLGRGLLPAVERAREAQAAGAPVPTDRTTLEGYLAVRQLLETVRGNDALSDYFWQVVEKPSVWSVLTHFGVAVRIAIPLEDSVVAAPPPGVPATSRSFAAPLRIEVNGAPALFVELIVGDARRPFALSGGILAAIARHPTRSDTTFRMQLLAARLGSVPRGLLAPKSEG